jgi:hypothetical protein
MQLNRSNASNNSPFVRWPKNAWKLQAALGPLIVAAVISIAGCGGGGGGGGGTAPNPVDKTPPTISITDPSDGGSYPISEPPGRVAVTYADKGSGVDPASLRVTVTMQGRTVNIENRFVETDGGAESDSSYADPLSRTSISRFGSTDDFETPEKTWSIDRCGTNTRNIISDGERILYAWDTECKKIWAINTTSGEIAEADTPGKVLSVAAAPTEEKVFAAVSGKSRLYIFDAASMALYGSVSLLYRPTAVSYDPENNLVYIAFESQKKIGVYSVTAEEPETSIPVYMTISVVPDILMARPGDSGEILVVGLDMQYRLFRYAPDGTELLKENLDPALPKGLAAIEDLGLAFVTNYYEEGFVRAVDLQSGTTTDIDVGSTPRGIFTAGHNVLIVNSGDSTISVINAEALSELPQTVSMATPATGGAFLNSGYYILEDLWQISGPVTVTINASIKDRAGNETHAAPIDITISHEVPGPA